MGCLLRPLSRPVKEGKEPAKEGALGHELRFERLGFKCGMPSAPLLLERTQALLSEGRKGQEEAGGLKATSN